MNLLDKRKQVEPPKDEVSKVHSPFYPAEVYLGERVSAELSLHTDSKNEKYRLPVWRLSPLGVELLVNTDNEFLFSLMQSGTQVDLNIQIKDQLCEFKGVVIVSKHQQHDKNLIGIRWCLDQGPSVEETEEKPKEANSPALERRKTQRWLCGTDFLPTGIAPNPVRFNDFVHFRVRDISKGGMMLLTSLRNKYLIPGMRLDSVISFPMCSQLNVPLRIARCWTVTQNGQEYLAIGVSFVENNPRLHAAIAQYVFQFGPRASVEELKRHGLNVPNASSGLDFGFVRTEEEYREVLELRRLAYSRAGKLPSDTPLEQVADIYDTRARILTARYRGELVGTVRMIFHNPEDSFEHEEQVVLPPDFPRKDQVVEVTRFAIHPDFRRSDLFYSLVRQVMISVAQAKRRWVFSSAATDLLPMYFKIGMKQIGDPFYYKSLGNIEHVMVLGDNAKSLTGEGVNPLVWNMVFSDLSGYIQDQDLIEFNPMMNIRMSLYRMLKPLAPLMNRRLKKRKSPENAPHAPPKTA